MANAPNLTLAAFPVLRRAKLLRNLPAVRVSRTVFDLDTDFPQMGTAAVAREGEKHPPSSAEERRERGGSESNGPASERGHVYGIFPFGDVEIRVNRFFDRNSRSIDAGRSHPSTPIPKLSPGARG